MHVRDGVRALAATTIAGLNRNARLNSQPFDPATPMRAPSGRRRNWAHYGVMIPDLPEPHRTFGVMTIVGSPGVQVFANDHAIITTPDDTSYTVSATATMTSAQFFTQSVAAECDLRPDGSFLRFGSELTMRGSYPDFSVRRTHPEVDVEVDITATESVSHFANFPGIYRHWSLLGRYTGTITYRGIRDRIEGLCTVEYATGVGIHSLFANTRRTLPATFFTYHVLNVDDVTQVLFGMVLGPAGFIIQQEVYIRTVETAGSIVYAAGIDFRVNRYEPEPRVTPDGRRMYVPRSMSWSLTDPEGRTIITVDGSVDDLVYGLGAGYVGNYEYRGSFQGRPIAGRAYLEYVDCR